MAKEEPAKRRWLSGGLAEKGDSAGVDVPDVDDVSGGMCNFRRMSTRP